MAAPATAKEIKDVNVRYHDAAAGDYDAKWGIDYGEAGRSQVVRKLRKALGARPAGFPRALEIGAGTGYFSLNLLRAGVIDEAVATDISPGMLAALRESAARLGLDVETAACEASALPFPDASFDLVFGHAVLHHLPDLDRAFAEFARVLRPGGTVAFCGEPSRYGDRLATLPKRAALALAPAWRRFVGAPPRGAGGGAGRAANAAATAAGEMNGNGGGGDHGLEWVVDVHAFTPRDLAAHAGRAGLQGVRVVGEELTASWFGWANRTLEGTADPDAVPRLWHEYAYRGYLALQRVDRALLEPRLPAALFYNLLVSARKPA